MEKALDSLKEQCLALFRQHFVRDDEVDMWKLSVVIGTTLVVLIISIYICDILSSSSVPESPSHASPKQRSTKDKAKKQNQRPQQLESKKKEKNSHTPGVSLKTLLKQQKKGTGAPITPTHESFSRVIKSGSTRAFVSAFAYSDCGRFLCVCGSDGTCTLILRKTIGTQNQKFFRWSCEFKFLRLVSPAHILMQLCCVFAATCPYFNTDLYLCLFFVCVWANSGV